MWVKSLRQILKMIDEFPRKDRLDVVAVVLLELTALNGSIHGWRSWMRNLPLMSRFTIDEIREIDKTLNKLTHAFIEYDIEATKKYHDKLPKFHIPKMVKPTRRKVRGEAGGMIV